MATAHRTGQDVQQYAASSPNADQAQINRLEAPAHKFLGDCSRILVFTADGQTLFARSCQVLALVTTCYSSLCAGPRCRAQAAQSISQGSSTLQASPAEMQRIQSLFGAREDALKTGIVLQNKRYEVRMTQTFEQVFRCSPLHHCGMD